MLRLISKYSLFSFVLMFLLKCVVFAGYPLITDDTYLIEKEKCEINAGFNCLGINEEHMMTVSFNHGLTNKMNFGLSSGYKVRTLGSQKTNNAELNFKVLLVNDLLAFNFSNALGSPNYFANLILSKKVFNSTFSFNIGYLRLSDLLSEGIGQYRIGSEYFVFRKFYILNEINLDDYGFNLYFMGARYELISNLNISSGVSIFQTSIPCYFVGISHGF